MQSACTETERKILKQLGLLVDQAVDLDLALGGVLEILMQGLPGLRCEITLRQPESGRLITRFLRGAAVVARAETDGDPVQALALRVIQNESPHFEAGRLCAIPLYRNAAVEGTLSAEANGGKIDSEAERILSVSGEMISRVLQLHCRLQALLEPVLKQPWGAGAGGHLLFEGQGQKMAEVRRLLYKVAPSQTPVLLGGPLGSGKAQAARLIHRLSTRSEQPLVQINCAHWSQPELERRLFGYDSNALDAGGQTGGGLLAQAGHGSVYLAEIDHLGPPLQAKLLTLLQEHYFEPMGGGQPLKCRARILAACRRDLAPAVERGEFRQDLYYRLNVFPIALPPLSQRREDIVPLAEFCLAQAGAGGGRHLSLNPQAAQVLSHYAWPGNLAELDNLCQRLALLAKEREITLEDLPSFVFEPPTRPAAGRHGSLSRLEEIERGEVVAALQRNNWVQSRAAAELGLTLRQIGYRVKKFGLGRTIQRGRGSGQHL